MLKIDRLSLTLPRGFENRAEAIAQRIAADLADTSREALPAQPGGAATHIARLAPSAVTALPSASDAEVARRITVAIRQQLANASPGGSR
ncbi:MAG: hypothetical protein AAF560_12800 [Acidobacteriota bacterium]